jgi:hypothetical protein
MVPNVTSIIGLNEFWTTTVSLYSLIPYTYSLRANGRNNGRETGKIFSFYIYRLPTMIPEIN